MSFLDTPTGLDRALWNLDLARRSVEEAARTYARVRLAGGRGAPGGVSGTRAELVRRRTALAAALDRVGALACPTPEAAVPLACAFRTARETLEQVDRLALGGKGRRRETAIPL